MAAPGEDPAPSGSSKTQADTNDLAQAYRELMRGEQAATALEANLSNLESKLDALLAAYDVTVTSDETTATGHAPASASEAGAGEREEKNKSPGQSKEPQDRKQA